MALTVSTKPVKTYEYIPLSERGEEKPFTINIRPLTKREYALIEDKIAKFYRDETMTFASASTNIETFQRGVTGWNNLLDENGKQIKPDKMNGMLTDDAINLLPIDIITEVANVIVGITKDPENTDIYLGTASDETQTESK